ncbi:MAG: hypothetical protein ACOX4U_03850 [Anaerovoracaceae bacterium]|jgi:hypothetical protein
MRDYNFFDGFQKKQEQAFDIKSPLFLGVMAIALIILVSGGLFLQKTLLNAGLVKASAELQEIKNSREYQEANTLQKQISAMEEYDSYAEAALKRVKDGDTLNSEFLRWLTNSMPNTASLESASINKLEAGFKFRVPNRKVVAELLENLESSDLFVQITLLTVTSGWESGGYIAEINGIIKAGEEV